MLMRLLIVFAWLGWCSVCCTAQTLQARDSGALGWGSSEEPAQQAILQAITWEPVSFEVTVEPGDGGYGGGSDAVVRFMSPRPTGDAALDTVVLEWFRGRDEKGNPLDRPCPAVLIVQSLHPQRAVARALARGLSTRAVHALVLTLPGFGPRDDARWAGWHPGVSAMVHATMGVADIRRSLDAVSALPGVEQHRIGAAGVSMGAMALAVSAGLDDRATFVALFLAGADLPTVLREGQHDASLLREELEASGAMRGVERVLPLIEPATLAPRWPPRKVWLVTARFDQVVPPVCTQRLIKAGDLPEDRVIEINGNHYNALLGVPAWSAWLAQRATETTEPFKQDAPPTGRE
jgi:hypothetical protein